VPDESDKVQLNHPVIAQSAMRNLTPILLRYSAVVVAASMWCVASIQHASATSLRFFGTGANNIDRVRVLIEQPGPAGGTPADIGRDDFTVEFWMKGTLDNTSSGVADGNNFSWIFGNIIIDRASVSQGTSWGMSVSREDPQQQPPSGQICFGLANVSNEQYTACGTTNVLDNQWHHVAVQRRRSDGRIWLFVDGVLDRVPSVDGPDGDLDYVDNQVPPNVCGPFQGDPCPQEHYVVFGAEKYDFNRLQYPSYFGWMDEIRFSNSLRYPTNGGGFTRPSAAFAPDAQTAALYHFDEGSGNIINDSAPGNASPGERLPGSSGLPQWSTDTPFGPNAGSVQFQSATPSVAENVGGGAATITITRTGGSSGTASVNYQTSGGTASAGNDYLSASGTLNWGNGDAASKTFTVTILDDPALEGSETIGLTLSSASGAALGSPQNATLTINDDETGPIPGTLQLSAASFTTNEGSGTVTLNVARSGGSSGTVSINYATSDGTAVVGNDYSNATGTLMWQGGDVAAKPISVSIANDTQAESAESFTVTLSSPSGGATLGAPASATVTINDDDSTSPPPPPPGNDSNGGGGGGSTGALLLSLLALSLGVRSRRQAAAPP
jgi:hypothetical protein